MQTPIGFQITRRQVLRRLGLGAVALALPRSVFGQAPSFPKGTIIRTVLRDSPPEEFAGGATLFHEHVQLAPDFSAKFAAAAAAARAANGLPPGPVPAPPPVPAMMNDVNGMSAEAAKAKGQGVACLVDAGNREMGRDIGFVREGSVNTVMP